MRHATGLLALVGLLCVNDADASISGDQLHRICRVEAGEPDVFCLGYVVGVEELLQLAKSAPLVEGLAAGYCRPEGMTNGQLVDRVREVLHADPALTHETEAVLMVLAALVYSFPCE